MIRFALIVVVLAAWVVRPAAADEVRRYVRFADGDRVGFAELAGDTAHVLDRDFLAGGQRTGEMRELSSLRLLPPVVPSKVLAVGLNYSRHGGSAASGHPRLFFKSPTSITTTGAPIPYAPDATNLHYEGEMVVLIGK